MRTYSMRAMCTAVAAAVLSGCLPPYTPRDLEPYWPTDGWRTADPRDAAMDPEMLERLVAEIERADRGVDSVLVVRHGYLVLDTYFSPFSAGRQHEVYSCTKSIVSTLIGMAIADGALAGTDVRLLDSLAGYSPANTSADKEGITLDHLLTMSAGLDARDSYLYDWEGLRTMLASADPVQHVLDLPMAFTPGERFEYTNGVSHLLSAIVTEATGSSALAIANARIFGPLGIADATWEADPQGRSWGYSKLRLNPHDMAKIGYLFLNDGRWDGTQVVDRSWVEAATALRLSATLVDGYGYQWWVDASGYYLALGYMGQFIFVVPQEGLVVVLTGSRPETFEFSLPLIESYILPAVVDHG